MFERIIIQSDIQFYGLLFSQTKIIKMKIDKKKILKNYLLHGNGIPLCYLIFDVLWDKLF